MVVFATIMSVGIGCPGVPDACTNHQAMCIDCDAGGEADEDSCVDEDSGQAKTGCQARASYSMTLMFGDGTEAAAAVCALTSGEGSETGQCEAPTNSGEQACEWSTNSCVPTATTTTQITDAWTESQASGMLSQFAGMAEAMQMDCSAGCTCNADDVETFMAHESSGAEGMPDVTTECMACMMQAQGDEAQATACMADAIEATTCDADETAVVMATEGDEAPEGVSLGCMMCLGEADDLPEAEQPAARVDCMTLTPCSFPDDEAKFDEMLECNASSDRNSSQDPDLARLS